MITEVNQHTCKYCGHKFVAVVASTPAPTATREILDRISTHFAIQAFHTEATSHIAHCTGVNDYEFMERSLEAD